MKETKVSTKDNYKTLLQELESEYRTFCRVSLHEGERCVALSYVPDAQHAILPSCGHYVLLVGVSVHTVQRDTIPKPKNKYNAN